MYRIVYSELYRQLVHDESLGLMKDLVTRMATGLQEMKSLRAIHGDLKLENILLPVKGESLKEARLIDFGSTVLLDQSEGLSNI